MVVSRKIKVVGILFLAILFANFYLISAQTTQACQIVKGNSQNPPIDGWNILLGLYQQTNSHGFLFSDSSPIETTKYYLNCNFLSQSSRTCTGTNKIIGLSSDTNDTNAHAEIKSLDNYETDVCYGNLNCATTTETSCPNFYPIQMFSLSSDTNAHIGNFTDYSNKICCSQTQVTIQCGNGAIETGEVCDGSVGCSTDCKKLAQWNDLSNKPISIATPIIETTQIKLIAKGLAPNTQVTFTIWEEDTGPDDKIIELQATTSSTSQNNPGGNAEVVWLIRQVDLDKTSDYDKFYFTISGLTSNYLKLTFEETSTTPPQSCSEYTQSSCNGQSVPGEENNNCAQCQWSNTGGGECQRTNVLGIGCNPVCVGVSYTESFSPTAKCTDGNLRYTITYTSDSTEQECQIPNKEVSCIKQTTLPFFNFGTFAISLILIFAIYFYIEFSKKKK